MASEKIPPAFEDYDVRRAFMRIENELIASMMRNLGRHLKEEEDEGFDWSQWQVEQLKYLQEYRRRNQKEYGPRFKSINEKIEEAIRHAHQNGQKDEELNILDAISKDKRIRPRYANPSQASIEGAGDAFFRINDRKLEALVKAAHDDLEKAERAVLRRTNDQYRKIIFDAQMYANTGAGTVEKAVDMATKDFLAKGIDSIQYKNGARHTISDYADMYIRTAERRAYLMGEGKKRQEWGEQLVIVNRRGTMTAGNYGHACPLCIPWLGKILIDDVYSGGKPDGKHELLSEAMAAGFLHPRCKDSFTTYIPGISPQEDPVTKQEAKKAVEAEKEENRLQYAERQQERYERLAEYSLDPENRRLYKGRADQWEEEKDRVRSYGEAPKYNRNEEIDNCVSTEQLEAFFPEISFLHNFSEIPLQKQKEVAQGLFYMKSLFGERAMPWTISVSTINDYGKTGLRSRKTTLKKNMGLEDIFSTVCHECIHVMDVNRGLLSESVFENARKKLRLRKNSRKLDKLILDLLGYQLYNRYRQDNAEIMAYAFEEYLYDSDNVLVMAIIEQLAGEMQ